MHSHWQSVLRSTKALAMLRWAGMAMVASLLGACHGTHDDAASPAPVYTIGGLLSGLTGTVVLADNGGNNLVLNANGPFVFSTALASGAGYSVTVVTQPVGQMCTSSNASGTTAAANITNIIITCVTVSVTTNIDANGGTVTGPDGVQVIIPAGALSASTAISIKRSSVGAPVVPAEFPVTGFMYEFTPHGIVFDKPVTIRLPVTGTASDPKVLIASVGEDWNLTDALVSGGFASFERNTFSWGYGSWSGCSFNINNPNLASGACVVPQGYVSVAATPNALVPTGTSTPNIPSAGSFGLTQAAMLEFTLHFTLPAQCTAITTKFTRSHFNSNSNTWGSIVTLSQPVPTLAMSGSTPMARTTGTSTHSIALTSADNGKDWFSGSVSCTDPAGTVRSYGDSIVIVSTISVPLAVYTVGGSVSGLTGSGLVLRNNGGDNLSVSASGSFTFSTSLTSGSSYGVSVFTQPSGQTCSVQNGSGTLQANVTNVAVTCATNSAPAWQGSTLIETDNAGRADGPQLAIDANGNVLAVWSQSDGTRRNIWANRYAIGSGWGGAVLLETDDSGDAGFYPQVAVDAAGNALAVWSQSDGALNSIWVNRYSVGNGWRGRTLLSSGNNNASSPRIAMNASGNAVAVWQQTDNRSVDFIWSAEYSVVGDSWSSPAFTVDTQAPHPGAGTNGSRTPKIAIDANGNAMAVWYLYDGTSQDIYANRLVAGSGWGTAQLIDTSNVAGAVAPEIAVTSAGNALAVWSQSDGTRYNIWANRYTAGTGWGAAQLIETDNAGRADGPQIAIDANGNGLAVWSQSDGTRYNIWANRYTAGTGWGTAQLIETDNSGSASGQSLAVDAAGNAMAVWSQSDGTRNNIWANRCSVGAGWGTAQLIETDNAGGAFDPRVGIDANGNATAIWSQSDGTRGNIWANRFQ